MRLLLSIAIAVLPLVTFGQIPFSLQDRAFITSTSPLRKDLVGYWRLEESSGTRYDFSKNGNHLTSNNSVGQTTGVSTYTGNCGQFVAASQQYLSIADNTSLSVGPGNVFTICGWVKFTTVVANKGITGKWGGTQNEYALTYAAITGSRFEFVVRDTANTTTTSVVSTNTGAASSGVWYFICAGYEGTNIWIQGNNGTVSAKPYTSGVNDSDSSFYIGDYTTVHATTSLNGVVDEIGIWRRWLTVAERTQLYNSGLGTHFPWAHP